MRVTTADAVIRELMMNLPEGIAADGLDPRLAFQRLEETLRRELDAAELAFVADHDGEVVIVSLEEKAAALYRVVPPLTVSRELLHVRGAVVRQDTNLADDDEPQLSFKLRCGASFTLRGRRGVDLPAIRSELEKRAAAG